MSGTGGTVSQLIHRAETVVLHKTALDFAGAAERFPGAAAHRFDTILATRLPDLPDHVPYNRARPCRQEHRHVLDDVLAFYADHGLRPAIEVWAADASTGLHRRLLDADLAPAPPTATLHAPPRQIDPPAGVEVREIRDDHEQYMDTLFRGYGLDPDQTALRTMLSIEHNTPGLRRYMAFIGGRPAAAAAMFTHEATSYLAGAATIPAYRRHGCQTALISRRLSDATGDSDLTVVTAAFASPSHDNLARLGFRLTHTRTVWQ